MIQMKTFLDKSSTGNPNSMASQGGKKKAWLSQDASRRNSGAGSTNKFAAKSTLTEDDLKGLSKAELRRNKEQYLTDIYVSVPDTLEIDMKLQTIDPPRKRLSKFCKEDLLANWCKDAFTALVFVSLVLNVCVFLYCLWFIP